MTVFLAIENKEVLFMKDFCNCIYSCECEYSRDLFSCPLDNTPDLEKDRSISRKRHHNSVKAKNKALRSARFLASKVSRIPDRARCRESLSTMSKKAWYATKNCKKFKKQWELENQDQFLVRK